MIKLKKMVDSKRKVTHRLPNNERLISNTVLKGPATEAFERLSKRRRTMDTMVSTIKFAGNFSSFLKMESAAPQGLTRNMDSKQAPFNVDSLFGAISATTDQDAFPTIEWKFDDDEKEELEACLTASS
jgi:hypothetical protein